MSQNVYIMCGVGFAGKSTLAKEIAQAKGAELVSQDAIWFEKESEIGEDWTDDQEWEFTRDIAFERIRAALGAGKSVVYDSTNLLRQHRDALRAIATEYGAGDFVIFLDTPESVLTERQERNKSTGERHDVPQELLSAAKAELERPGNDENTYVFGPSGNLPAFLVALP